MIDLFLIVEPQSVVIYAHADPLEEWQAMDVVLEWWPGVKITDLEILLPEDDLFAAGWFNDPDGLNDNLGDGDAILTLLGRLTPACCCPPVIDGDVALARITFSSSTPVCIADQLGIWADTLILQCGNWNVLGEIGPCVGTWRHWLVEWGLYREVAEVLDNALQ